MTLRRALAALAAIVAVAACPAPARADESQPYHLYYTVTGSYQGRPENLWEIAARFLGDGNRAGEILDLNTDRVQPDGARLTDAGSLHAGWNLVLPWDAIGAEVHNGVLPAAGATPSAPGTPPASSSVRPPAAGCARDSAVPASASWAQTLLAPDRIWADTDGAGVRVAVADSGVDGTRPQLAGRVSAGADLAGGSGRGDSDCLGTGTAIAGIVAGDGGKQFGLAPKAVIVPIRLAGRTAAVPARKAATGIQVAVSAGASVIVVGARVDATDPAVRAAIDNALAHDVVVVVPAPGGARRAVVAPGGGLLRVGGVGRDHRPVADYPAGSADLVAPGEDIATIGRAAGGTEYAAAFVAGTVALLRSAYPKLRAADVTAQVLRTAKAETGGYGLVDPYAAVVSPLPAGVVATRAAPAGDRTAGRVLLGIGLGLLGVLLLTILLGWLRAIRRARAARDRSAEEQDDPFRRPAGAATGAR